MNYSHEEYIELSHYWKDLYNKQQEQITKLEEKLRAITCIECEKDLLDCTCDAINTQLNL